MKQKYLGSAGSGMLVLMTCLATVAQAAADNSGAQGSTQENPVPGTSNTPQSVGKPPETDKNGGPPAIETLIDYAGVLTPKGKFVLEPTVQYVHSSVYRIGVEGYSVLPAILIGAIQVEDTSSDTYMTALTGRYGVSNRLEVEARVPYVWRSESTLTRNLGNQGTDKPILMSADGQGIGDVELAAHYQLNRGPVGPYYVANMRVRAPTGKNPFEIPLSPTTGLATKLPTGTGFWGVQPSINAIFPSDPAVFYGNLSYLWNIKRNFGGAYGEIDPGDAIGFGFGMGLSLNDKASFSLGYDHSIVGKPLQNGQAVANSRVQQVGSVLFGYSYRVSPRTGFNLNFAIGATSDAPDVQLTLRLPITF